MRSYPTADPDPDLEPNPDPEKEPAGQQHTSNYTKAMGGKVDRAAIKF
jgi:hypothetical protein